jgi:rhomboid protease GluP
MQSPGTGRQHVLDRVKASPFSLAIALMPVMAWGISATVLAQPLHLAQLSRDLLTVGAADGHVLVTHEWWRLLTSQFLHVYGIRMLFNSALVYALARAIECSCGSKATAVIFFVGGTAGQLASVLVYPDLVSSGSSQALAALCGASIVLGRTRASPWIATFAISVQLILDLVVADHVKAGHAVGFATGLLIGWVLLCSPRKQ